MKKFFKRLFSRRILLIVHFLLTAFFLFTLYRSSLLPLKYFIPLAIILVLLIFWLYKGQKPVKVMKHGKQEKKIVPINVIAKFLQIVLIFALIFGNYYIIKSNGFIDGLISDGSNYLEYSVNVLKEDSAKDIEDTSGYIFGYMKSKDASENTNLNQVVSKIGNDINETLTPTTYSSQEKTLNGLYNGDVNAIIINELDRDSYVSVKSNFNKETKVIKKYKIKIASADANRAEVTKEAFTVFISGIDTYGSIKKSSLSDVNMLATINPVTKQILLISIPRDYYIPIAGMNGSDKLTHTAFKGISCTVDSIKNYLNIDINYYVKLNYTSFMKVIDAIDGIDIYNPYGTFTTRVKFFKIKKGWNHLTAKQALAFVRERHSFGDGDRIRGINQQLMIKAILKKITSASSITKLNDIFDAVSGSMETNMDSSEIRSLINMELDDMATWDVQTYHLDGTNYRTKNFAIVTNTNPNGLYVMMPNQETATQAKKYIKKIKKNKLIKIKSTDENIKADPNANDKYKK